MRKLNILLIIILALLIIIPGCSQVPPINTPTPASSGESKNTPSEPTVPVEPSATEFSDKVPVSVRPASELENQNYKVIDSREFKKIAKNPSAYAGQFYIIYGEITQFDAATGDGAFLAYIDGKKQKIVDGYVNYEQNAMLIGDSLQLAEFVQNDCFKVEIMVLGSFSYDTQIGGATIVPLFQIHSIARYGSTE